MILGALIVIAIARLMRKVEYGAMRTVTVVAGVAVIVGAVFFVLSGSDEAASELFDRDLSKLKMFAETIRSLPAMPFFGCGRGAFESAFPVFRTDPGYSTYTHPENVVAQWVVEWGLPVGIAGLATIAFALRPNVVLARSMTAAGAWGGIAALVVQNFADLGTEIPGLVLAGVVCVAIVVAGTRGGESTWRVEGWARGPRRVAIGAAIASAIALLLALGVLGKELNDDQNAMHDAVLGRHRSMVEVHAIARGAMLRHPAEPYLPFMASLRAWQGRDDNPIPWIGAALERAQVYGPAHLVLARVLATRSPSQARLEYRLAMQQAPELAGPVVLEAVHIVNGYFDATELVPEGHAGVAVMELLAQAIDARLPATRVRVDADLVARASTAPGPALRSTRDAVDDLEAVGGAPWCEGTGRVRCVSTALSEALRVEQMAPDKCDGYALHARARVASGDAAGGVAELEKAAGEVADRLPCLRQLVALAHAAKSESGVEAALHSLVTAGCASETECAQNLLWVGREYEAAGSPHKALAQYKRALEHVPDDALLAHMADLAASGGLHAEAAADYEQLARKHPGETRWKSLAVAQHDAAMREAEKL